jgi:hypothetical protein
VIVPERDNDHYDPDLHVWPGNTFPGQIGMWTEGIAEPRHGRLIGFRFQDTDAELRAALAEEHW